MINLELILMEMTFCAVAVSITGFLKKPLTEDHVWAKIRVDLTSKTNKSRKGFSVLLRFESRDFVF